MNRSDKMIQKIIFLDGSGHLPRRYNSEGLVSSPNQELTDHFRLKSLVLDSVHEKPEIENLKNFRRSESVEKDRSRKVSISKILKTYLNSFAIEEENFFEIEILGMK